VTYNYPMIATLRGEISQIEDNALIVEVGGMGLRVFVPAPLRGQSKAGEPIFLFTHFVVREDAFLLYGFESQSDRELFHILLGVDGVGPKVALSVLSTMTLDAIQRAVFGDEPDVLSRVPGVGKKTAQKMALHLKDKLKPVDSLSKLAAISDTDAEVIAAAGLLGGRSPSRAPIHPQGRARRHRRTPQAGAGVFSVDRFIVKGVRNDR